MRQVFKTYLLSVIIHEKHVQLYDAIATSNIQKQTKLGESSMRSAMEDTFRDNNASHSVLSQLLSKKISFIQF